jgi:hypothetical protein
MFQAGSKGQGELRRVKFLAELARHSLARHSLQIALSVKIA